MKKNTMYQFNKKNIQGGAGRLIISLDTTARPTRISEIMDLKTFKLMDGYNDLGATTEGITQSRGFETENVEVDQSKTPIDETISSWSNTISTTLQETHIENRQLVGVGGSITETPAQIGTGVKLKTALRKGATVIKVADGEPFKDCSFIKIGKTMLPVVSLSENTIRLRKGVEESTTGEADMLAYPVIELGTKTISYGSPDSVTPFQLILISQRDNGTLLMVVYYEVKLSGDSVETSYGKEKRSLPVGFTAFSQDDLPDDENVFIEIEQIV